MIGDSLAPKAIRPYRSSMSLAPGRSLYEGTSSTRDILACAVHAAAIRFVRTLRDACAVHALFLNVV